MDRNQSSMVDLNNHQESRKVGIKLRSFKLRDDLLINPKDFNKELSKVLMIYLRIFIIGDQHFEGGEEQKRNELASTL